MCHIARKLDNGDIFIVPTTDFDNNYLNVTHTNDQHIKTDMNGDYEWRLMETDGDTKTPERDWALCQDSRYLAYQLCL